ncbi:hypothetical protein GCK72_020332 [Caenorhabditis remanei]|uniref:Peptidase M13 N-terminal domain-containing protein n=1 Tax=Caenorhabditis remanei TaxID=31234 RepID=A0A6A5GGT3_CAERE|nr:hypothetical protein GCK72_020332 [Caenorhabditis remanei]KAF1753775.1 hypothetical protein GCK72_020332 [Caenorhabditis remanei]
MTATRSSKWTLLTVVLIGIFVVPATALVAPTPAEAPDASIAPKRSRPEKHSVKYSGVCKSPECMNLAHQLHDWRNISVDPCENFFEATCGKHSGFYDSRVSKKTIKVAQFLDDFLKTPQPSLSPSKSGKVMKQFYDLCEKWKVMNETEQREEQSKAISDMIKKWGPIPMFDKNWKESDFDLNELLMRSASFGILDLALFMVDIEDDNRILLNYDYVLKSNDFENYRTEALRKKNRVDPNVIQDDYNKLVKLSKYLYMNIEFYSDSVGVPLPQLQAKVPSLNFEKILKRLFQEKRQDEVWENIKDRITGSHIPYFFHNYTSLEETLQHTSNRTLANYIGIHFMNSIRSTVGLEFRSDRCAAEVAEKLPLASHINFALNRFDKKNIQLASEMVEDIQKSVVETIEKSTWLNESTKTKAIRKVKTMKKVIAYPKELENPAELDVFFDSLDLSETNSFVVAKRAVGRFQIQQKMNYISKLLPYFPKLEYANGKGYYDPVSNLLTVRAELLDVSLFDSTFPKYAKIARIGEEIGHEIGRALDPINRKLDRNGEWFTPEDATEYDRRAQCLIDQYTNYDDPYFEYLNGKSTIRELTADLIGINASWKTYEKVDFSKEPSVFGFEDAKPRKFFFQLTAVNFCKAKGDYLFDGHPIPSFRVNGIFSNMKEFSEAFKCPVGSPMNPVKKCELF